MAVGVSMISIVGYTWFPGYLKPFTVLAGPSPAYSQVSDIKGNNMVKIQYDTVKGKCDSRRE